MLEIFIKWIVYSALIVFVSWIIPGIDIDNFASALFVCIVIAVINIYIKPILKLITLPVTMLTLGLFSLVINAFVLMLASWISPGFEVEGFLSAFLGALCLSLLTVGINRI